MLRLTLPVMLLCAVPLCVRGEDWPQWRGPDRTGVSKETGLLKSWPKEGPKLVWTGEGAGRGYATLAVSKGRIYTLGDGLSTADDKDEYLSCFSESDGKQVWKTKLGPAWNSGQANWQSSRSTPTVDGELLFVVSPQGVLSCLATADGKVKWTKDLKKDFSGSKGDGWGYSESPLVDGENVICTPGNSTSTMVALKKSSGEIVWKCPSKGDKGAGHASIVVSEIGGTKVYVTTTASGAMGVRAKDGKLMWNYAIDRTTAVIPTPIIKGDLVFFSAGYNRGGALLKQEANGEGEVTVKEVYGLKTPLNNKHGGIVLVGDYLYGDTNDSGSPFCADLKTGEVKWKGRGSGRNSASLTAAEGKLYIRFADNTIALVDADPKAYKEISTFKIAGGTGRPGWSHPVIANGRLYIREQDKILCYDIKDSARGGR